MPRARTVQHALTWRWTWLCWCGLYGPFSRLHAFDGAPHGDDAALCGRIIPAEASVEPPLARDQLKCKRCVAIARALR